MVEPRVQIITSYDELVALRPVWRELEAACAAVLPFQTWEWAVSWWNHLREDGIGVRDSMRVCVVRDEALRVLAIAPLMLTERPAVGPLRIRYLQPFGADPNITEIRTILCLPGYERLCYTAIRECFAEACHPWHWVAWDGLPCGNGQMDPIAGKLLDPQETSAFVIRLTPTWDSFKSTLGRNIKESLRKCYNSLRRDGLTCTLDTIDDSTAIDCALHEFFRLHSERASLNDGPRHGDVFASPQARSFLTEVCRNLCERGVAKVFRLRIGDRIVATRIGFELGKTLYLYYSGWDPAFAKYSVMTTLVAEIIQDALSRGLSTVNLSTGRDVSKTRWGPTEMTWVGGAELAPGALARVAYLGFRIVSHPGARRVVRQLLPPALLRRPNKTFP